MSNPLNLKVGDIVRLNPNNPYTFRFFHNVDAVIVSMIDECDTRLPYSCRTSSLGGSIWLPADAILGKVGERKQTQRKFKPGDKVRASAEFISERQGIGWVEDVIGRTMTVESASPCCISVYEFPYAFVPKWLEHEDERTGAEYVAEIAACAKDMLSPSTSRKRDKRININLIDNHSLLTNLKLD